MTKRKAKAAAEPTTEVTQEAQAPEVAQEAVTPEATEEVALEVVAEEVAVPEAKADQPAPKVEVTAAAWPRQFKVTNNTPIPLHLSEVGVMLPANFNAPLNAATVSFVSEDALTREKTNADAIGRAHGFSDVLIIEEAAN